VGVDVASLRRSLERDGFLLLHDVPDAARLQAIAHQLGEVIRPWVGMPGDTRTGLTYEVRVRNAGEGERNMQGNVVLSTTAREFPLHTDGYNQEPPPHYVLLLRTDDSSERPTSQIARFETAVRKLSPSDQALLGEPLFPSALGYLPLRRVVDGRPVAKFNLQDMEQADARLAEGPGPAKEWRAVASALGEALASSADTTTIGPGDALVLDNWQVCHGRSRLANDSQRVLLRMWVR
jgi:alpha-ketoglutarate-dependent taurine dioxygenase